MLSWTVSAEPRGELAVHRERLHISGPRVNREMSDGRPVDRESARFRIGPENAMTPAKRHLDFVIGICGRAKFCPKSSPSLNGCHSTKDSLSDCCRYWRRTNVSNRTSWRTPITFSSGGPIWKAPSGLNSSSPHVRRLSGAVEQCGRGGFGEPSYKGRHLTKNVFSLLVTSRLVTPGERSGLRRREPAGNRWTAGPPGRARCDAAARLLPGSEAHRRQADSRRRTVAWASAPGPSV